MFTQPILSTSTASNDKNQQKLDNGITQEAVMEYNLASLHGVVSKVWTKFTRRPNRLSDLEELQTNLVIRGSHYGGIRSVPIEEIRGSEGRTRDFDASFHPLNPLSRHRWQSIFMAMKRSIPLPPVELVQIGKVYFVRDGHHRISVAKMLGQVDIDAQVTVLEVAQKNISNRPASSKLPTAPILPAVSCSVCG